MNGSAIHLIDRAVYVAVKKAETLVAQGRYKEGEALLWAVALEMRKAGATPARYRVLARVEEELSRLSQLEV